jgi:hypothetical protein
VFSAWNYISGKQPWKEKQYLEKNTQGVAAPKLRIFRMQTVPWKTRRMMTYPT